MGREGDGEEEGVDDVGEGDVEEVASHAAALIEAVGLEDGGEGRTGLDEGSARGAVEGEEVDEGMAVEVGGVVVTAEVGEAVEDGGAGDGGVGVGDVEAVVDEGGVPFPDHLGTVDGGVEATWGAAVLTLGFEEGATCTGDGAGDVAGDVASEDMVAAEGAEGGDLVCGGGHGAGFLIGFALAGGGFGLEEEAVGSGGSPILDGFEEEGEEGEEVGAGEEVGGAGAGAVRGAGGVGGDCAGPGGDDGGAALGVVDVPRARWVGGVGGGGELVGCV